MNNDSNALYAKRALSSMIAVVLMVGITVVLSGVLLGVVLDTGSGTQQHVDATVDVTATEGNDYIVTVRDMDGADKIQFSCGEEAASLTEIGASGDVRGQCDMFTVTAIVDDTEQTIFSENTGDMDRQERNLPRPDAPSDLTNCHDDMGQNADGQYVIRNTHDLQCMNADRSADYVLGNDIDASGTDTWNGGEGFEPIGDSDTPFSGSFDGQNHTITGLTIDRDAHRQGLFGVVETADYVKNVHSEDVDIDSWGLTGGLIGSLADGGTTVSNVTVSGEVDGTNLTGGVIGGLYSNNSVSHVHAHVRVTASSDNVGGAIGRMRSPVEDVHATGDVTTTSSDGDSFVGGVIGNVQLAEANNISASGDVSGEGDRVGGLVGNIHSSSPGISNGKASGDVTSEGRFAGGLVGGAWSSITGSHATGDVEITTASDYAGGIVGYLDADMATSYATGTVTGEEYVGGVAGRVNTGETTDVFALGDVSGEAHVGGSVGRLNDDATINRAFVSNDVASDGSTSGAFTGRNTGTLMGWYYDKTYHPDHDSDNALTREEITGEEAPENMDEFDFTDVPVWVVGDNFPYLAE